MNSLHNHRSNHDSVLAAARAFHGRGWSAVALAAGEKHPLHSNWRDRTFTSDEISQHFSGEKNAGIVLGGRSGGLIDVDIDSPLAPARARKWLPTTDMRHAPASKPNSHYWYRDPINHGKTLQFKTPDGSVLLERRASGGQTAVPPSLHPSGERLEWHSESEPAECAREALEPIVTAGAPGVDSNTSSRAC